MAHYARLLSTLLCFFTFLSVSFAQTRLEIINEQKSGTETGTVFRYVFENDRFTTPYQEVEFNAEGKGQFRFRRKEGGQLGEEIVNPLVVSPSIVNQMRSLLNEIQFLQSSEDYQYKKDFSHLGTITITHANGGQSRTVKFNYTQNQALAQVVEIFRNIATQETRIFEIETVRTNDPISTPAQLRMLENELRSKHIADPEKLMPLLQEIKTDESVPLIARNHAERLIQSIKKGR
ncbi:MAG TPA: hypothetical protein VEF04_04135 [Blastocatellia bacterium]|nr:hypothetical protein [Blastocatellia bacterium]